MNSLILVMSFWGIVASLFAYRCAKGHATDINDTLFFGTKVPWAFVGVAGYVLIAATASLPVVTKTLAVLVALVTIFLIIKAVRTGIFCPGCVFTWFINGMFILLAFTTGPQES